MDTNDLILALQGNRKIDAIKALRDIVSKGLDYASSGTVQRVGLRECKEAVEAIMAAFPVDTTGFITPNSKSEYPTFNPLFPAEESEPEYIVSVHDDFDEYSHTFTCEQAAMDYAEGRRRSKVTVGKIIAKTVPVTTYVLKRV